MSVMFSDMPDVALVGQLNQLLREASGLLGGDKDRGGRVEGNTPIYASLILDLKWLLGEFERRGLAVPNGEGKETYNPGCTKCGKPMGECSEDEFIAIVLAEGLHGLCFDCEDKEDGPSMYFPDVFVFGLRGDVIHVGEVNLLEIDTFVLVKVEPELETRAWVNRQARARGLSSSTYLNTPNYIWLPDWILTPKFSPSGVRPEDEKLFVDWIALEEEQAWVNFRRDRFGVADDE